MKGELIFGTGAFRDRRVYHARSRTAQGTTVMRLAVYAHGGNLAEYVVKDRDGKSRNILFEAPWDQHDPNVVELGNEKFKYYGGDDVRKRVASVGGSSLCFPVFGPGTMAATGGLHGEANIVTWKMTRNKQTCFSMEAQLPITGWHLRRTFRFHPGDSAVNVVTDYDNLGNTSKNITWAEHMNFGEFALQSRLYLPPRTNVHNNPKQFHVEHSLFREGGKSAWPFAEGRDERQIDMTTFGVPGRDNMPQSDFTAQVIDKSNPDGWFILHNARLGIAMTVVWPREEAPFLGRWIENRARTFSPWDGRTQVMGLEWARSPFAGGLDDAVAMQSLDGNPTYLTIPARGSFSTQFEMRASAADEIRDPLEFMKNYRPG
jgi:hypothetical protein